MKKEPYCHKKMVLILNGSPNKSGATSKLINAFRQGLDSDTSIVEYNAFKEKPLPCNDCQVCHQKDMCAFRDLDEYYNLYEKADAIVYASPVYNLSFTTPLKNLIDRGQRYWAARFIRNKRYPVQNLRPVVLLTVAGTDMAPEPVKYVGQMLELQLVPALTVLGAELVCTVHHTGTDLNRDITHALKASKQAAQNLFN